MEKIHEGSIEAIANYQGNDSLLLFERVSNPVIREQIIGLLIEGERSRDGSPVEVLEEESPGVFKKDEAGEIVVKTIPYRARSREEIESDLDEAIQREVSVTNISFNDDPNMQSSSSEIEMRALAPWNGKPFNEKQMSNIEAHEKGHNLRPYRADFFKTHFQGAFSFDDKVITDRDIEMYRKVLNEDERNEPDEKIREIILDYLFYPMEIAERMSQLKNYFGMSADDTFTREHLHYAVEHYVADTGVDNGMGMFFRAIKPETEDEFIRLINCSGI
ncbi:MAG: hypothetical protein WC763_02030 [Candidatus Paceibacterota bacterium]|jgi:hypothetical protein